MLSAPPLGLLILDRDPFTYGDFLGLLQAWLQDAGGFAMLGLFAYIVYALTRPPEQAASSRDRAGVSGAMLTCAVLAIFCYAAYIFLVVTGRGADMANFKPINYDYNAFVKYTPPKFSRDWQPLTLMLGGLFALVGVGQPFFQSLAKVRFGRLWALTKLGFKEAIRSRLFLVFLGFLLPALFPANWWLQIKPEDELRTSLGISSIAQQILLLFPAALLAAFSIPNDIKNQNIYTIVTKPVERFEILAGRFFGYVVLMTLALLAMTAFAVVLIYTGRVDEKAAGETYMARQPVRGGLEFVSRKGVSDGTNVGREFDYRKYIGGDPGTSQRALYTFRKLPSGLGGGRAAVPLEFTFDIFRMTKGQENRGVDLDIRVVSHRCPQVPPTEARDGQWKWADAAKERAYQEDAKAEVAKLAGRAGQNPAAVLAGARPGTPAWDVVNRLAEKYGFYEVTGKEVFDMHPYSVPVPAALFANAAAEAPKANADGTVPPAVSVYVKCLTPGQMLGMAEGDLYFLQNEPVPSSRAFALNYFKAAFGLWCRVTLVIGLAVCWSTYLAGVISFLGTAFLLLAGYFTEHIQDMATGRSFVGGPGRALLQLSEAKQPTMPLDSNNPLTKVGEGLDQGFAWMVRRFINMVPDVSAYSWEPFVKEGFDVPVEYLVMNAVVLVGYLLPWFILGYFLLRSREVAA